MMRQDTVCGQVVNLECLVLNKPIGGNIFEISNRWPVRLFESLDYLLNSSKFIFSETGK